METAASIVTIATRWIGLALALLAAALQVTPAAVAGFPVDLLRGGIPTLAPVVDKVASGVVTVIVMSMTPDPARPDALTIARGSGSGVIVDAGHGYVLTNAHVVENADWVVVELIDGRTFDAQLLGADTATDIAVLSIEADNLPQVELGKSSSLRVGDLVLAVGNPFGIGQTVTSGIVSALGRGLSLEGFEDFIQTDAAVNPGNSGGALVDMEGRVVGLCTAIIGPGANIGIAFAVPIDLARAVMEQLVEFGEMRRPRVGIELVDLSAAMIADLGHGGAMVYRTTPGSAAALAGLKAGDVISPLVRRARGAASGRRGLRSVRP